MKATRSGSGQHAALHYDTGMSPIPMLEADVFRREPARLATALRDHGLCIVSGWPDAGLTAALRADLLRLQALGALSPAAVGRGGTHGLRSDIRGDCTLWLDDPRCAEAAGTFLAELDHVRTALNRHLFLGLVEFEAHYAVYPPGQGYARHRDRFRDSDLRTVSWVSYLNDDWESDDGGALRLYPQEPMDERAIEVPPKGVSVCFLSEIEHEVLPARRQRLSIAGWLRRRGSAMP